MTKTYNKRKVGRPKKEKTLSSIDKASSRFTEEHEQRYLHISKYKFYGVLLLILDFILMIGIIYDHNVPYTSVIEDYSFLNFSDMFAFVVGALAITAGIVYLFVVGITLIFKE